MVSGSLGDGAAVWHDRPVATELAGVSTWPEQWRWDDDLVDGYRARGLTGVRVEEVVHEGVRESAVLLPMRRPPRWQGLVFVLMGLVFEALAVVLGWHVLIAFDPLELAAVLVFAVVGGCSLGAAWLEFVTRRDLVPGLLLTPSRVLRRGGDGESLAVAWADIAEVSAYLRVSGRSRWHNMFGIDVHDPDAFWRAAGRRRMGRTAREIAGTRVVTVPDAVLAMNPLVAYHLVRHYLRHPEQRADLPDAVRPRD